MNIPNVNFGCLFISITSMYLCFKVWEAREAPVEAYMCDLWAFRDGGIVYLYLGPSGHKS